MAWIESLYDAPGRELVSGVATCQACSSYVWLCQCGTPNGVYEHQHDEWVECEGGCGVEARYRAELDRKGAVGGDPADRSRSSCWDRGRLLGGSHTKGQTRAGRGS